ncbi:MAG TPA: hypothetical protein VFA89_16170 [Terriglobales bacterium]|nr:hypothetical protein [Terriglobales bacterium]
MAQPLRADPLTAGEADPGIADPNANATPTTSSGSPLREAADGNLSSGVAGPIPVEPAITPSYTEFGVVGALGSEEGEPAANTLEDMGRMASNVLERVKVRATAAFNRTADAFEGAREISADWLQQTRRRTRKICDERPLQVIAGVAGAAFIAGILLRFWRSSRYE